jgi:uncharacterized protein (DUF302 family)
MYYFTQVVNKTFEEASALITEALKTEGFGILTEIDAQAAFKKKLNQDFRRYLILGACHPRIAYQMLQLDDKAGTLYPCNVVVQEHEDGTVEVSAINPEAMFHHLQNDKAKEIAHHASQLMQSVMEEFTQAAQQESPVLVNS